MLPFLSCCSIVPHFISTYVFLFPLYIFVTLWPFLCDRYHYDINISLCKNRIIHDILYIYSRLIYECHWCVSIHILVMNAVEKDNYSVQKREVNLTVLLLITEMNHATESNNYTVIGICAREKNRN